MSIENVRRFYETIAVDKDLKNRVIQASREYSLTNVTNDELENLMAEEFLPLLKEEGFDFTIDELTEYQKQLNTTLDTNKYEYISGGTGYSSAVRDFLEKIL